MQLQEIYFPQEFSRVFYNHSYMIYLVDTSDIFYFVSALGGERGSQRRREAGGGVSILY